MNLGENMTPNFLSCHFLLILNVTKVNLAFKTLQDLFVYFSTTQFTAFRKTETYMYWLKEIQKLDFTLDINDKRRTFLETIIFNESACTI